MSLKRHHELGYIGFLSFLLVLWWVALWGIIDESIDWIEEKTGVARRYQLWGILLIVTGFGFTHPKLLDRI